MKIIGDGTIISGAEKNSENARQTPDLHCFADCEVVGSSIAQTLKMPPIKPFVKNKEEYVERMRDVFNDVIEYPQSPYKLPPRELNIENVYQLNRCGSKSISEDEKETRLVLARIVVPSFLCGDKRVCPSLRSLLIGQQFDQEVEKTIKQEQKEYDEANFITKLFGKQDPSKELKYRPSLKVLSYNSTITEYVGYQQLDKREFRWLLNTGYIEIVDANGNVIENAQERLWEKIPMYIRITPKGFQMLKEGDFFRERDFLDSVE